MLSDTRRSTRRGQERTAIQSLIIDSARLEGTDLCSGHIVHASLTWLQWMDIGVEQPRIELGSSEQLVFVLQQFPFKCGSPGLGVTVQVHQVVFPTSQPPSEGATTSFHGVSQTYLTVGSYHARNGRRR